jgi:hypothetical protein
VKTIRAKPWTESPVARKAAQDLSASMAQFFRKYRTDLGNGSVAELWQ